MIQTNHPQWGRRRQRNIAAKFGPVVQDIVVLVGCEAGSDVKITNVTIRGTCATCGKHIGRGIGLHRKRCKG